MKPLDVVNCVDYGYRLSWAERAYFARLAAVPFLIKLLCLLTVQQLGWETNFLRQGMVLLPSFLAEGWMLAHISRLVFLNQRWPFRSTGNPATDEALLNDRAHGVLGGAVCYALIRFLMSGLAAALFDAQSAAQAQLVTGQAHHADLTTATFLIAMLLTGLTLWSCRLIFLYIPASVGISMKLILRAPQSFWMSLQMVGIWMVCYIPPMMLVLLFANMLMMSEGPAAFPVRLIFLLLQVLVDTVITIIGTAAIASGIKDMLSARTDA